MTVLIVSLCIAAFLVWLWFDVRSDLKHQDELKDALLSEIEVLKLDRDFWRKQALALQREEGVTVVEPKKARKSKGKATKRKSPKGAKEVAPGVYTMPGIRSAFAPAEVHSLKTLVRTSRSTKTLR